MSWPSYKKIIVYRKFCMAHVNDKNCTFLNSSPSEDAWVFAKWNAVQAVGVMSFGELAPNLK